MTVCIGVIDKPNHCCYVGADCGISYNSFSSTTNTPKVFHPCGRKDIIIGCAGSIRLANLLSADDSLFDNIPTTEYSVEIKELIQTVIPKIKAHAESLKRENDEFDLIIAIKDKLYRVQADYSIYESGGWLEIIGSGCETAFGAMRTAEGYDPCNNYEAHIKSAISLCAEYNYGITARSLVLCTKPI